MNIQDIKNKFEEIRSVLPEDLLSVAKLEVEKNKISLKWPGGLLTFGQIETNGEALLHVYKIAGGREYYCTYPIYPGGKAKDIELLNDLVEDIDELKPNLLC